MKVESLGRYALKRLSHESGCMYFAFEAKKNGTSVLALIDGKAWLIPLEANVPALEVELKSGGPALKGEK